MKAKDVLKMICLGLLIALSGASCAKKTKTFPTTNGGPAAPAPVTTPPPAVNWNNPGTTNTVYNDPNLCYVSNTNYFNGYSSQTIVEPVYGVYYDYCSGYYRYYFQGYYYYFSPTGNCGAGGWGPPQMMPQYNTCTYGCY